jgi:hypothetical protein
VDGDGDLDALSANNNGTIAWYENDGASPPAWTQRTITTTAPGARSVFAADVDGDGDLDALSASSFDDTIAWYENDGASPPAWTQRTITTTADGARSVFAADVDGDGDLDTLSASANDDTVAWYENDGASPPAWTQRTITTTAASARSIFAADVDGDGDLDTLSASAWDHTVAWYENLGGQFGLSTISTAPGAVLDGQTSAVLEVVLTHNGRVGDTGAEWMRLVLLFEETAGDPLTGAEAAVLFDSVDVYLDDGSGTFETGGDTLVGNLPFDLSAGLGVAVFTDADPDVRVAPDTPKTFFVVVEMADDASTQPTTSFRLSHNEAFSTCENVDTDGLLQQDSPLDTVSTGTVTVEDDGTAAGAVPDGAGVPGAGLTVDLSAAPGDLDLSWGASCIATDFDYVVYEGVIEDFTSHVPVAAPNCTTGGATSATITPGTGNRYYLIVPLSSTGFEGSYGFESDGTTTTTRPASLSPCAAQIVGSCP